MSRKYREYKAYLIALYAFEGKFPSYKMTLSRYKKIKREVQWHKKNGSWSLLSPRRGVTLVTSIQYDSYKIYDEIVFGKSIWFEKLDEIWRNNDRHFGG